MRVEDELGLRDYICVGVSGIFLILQQLGKNSINEKFHSRFFRSKNIKKKKKIGEEFSLLLALFPVFVKRQNLLCCARVEIACFSLSLVAQIILLTALEQMKVEHM